MPTTEKNIALDMIDNIEDIGERVRVLATYIKQMNTSYRHLQTNCPGVQHHFNEQLRKIEYIIKGDDGSNGLKGKILILESEMKLIKRQVEQNEDETTAFRNEFKVTMAKAGVILSVILLFGVPIISRFLDKLLP